MKVKVMLMSASVAALAVLSNGCVAPGEGAEGQQDVTFDSIASVSSASVPTSNPPPSGGSPGAPGLLPAPSPTAPAYPNPFPSAKPFPMPTVTSLPNPVPPPSGGSLIIEGPAEVAGARTEVVLYLSSSDKACQALARSAQEQGKGLHVVGEGTSEPIAVAQILTYPPMPAPSASLAITLTSVSKCEIAGGSIVQPEPDPVSNQD